MNKYWCRYSRRVGIKLVAWKQEGDQLWSAVSKEQAALTFWEFNCRNHPLPVVVSVIDEEEISHAEVEIAKVVVSNTVTWCVKGVDNVWITRG